MFGGVWCVGVDSRLMCSSCVLFSIVLLMIWLVGVVGSG